MIQFVLFGLFFCVVAIEDTAGINETNFQYSAEARRLVRQAKWATFSTMSADGLPVTTVLSTACSNGEIYFYMLNTDIPAMDTDMDTRITFTFNGKEGDDQIPTLISGHVKKLESGTEHTRGSKAFSLHHPEASEWDTSSYHNFSLCKLDITNVIVLRKDSVGQITSREYYAEIDSYYFNDITYTRQETKMIASMARRLVQQANWATLTTVLADGYPMTTVLSTAESNGDIFFNLLDVHMRPIDKNNGDRVAFMFSDAQEIDCNDKGDDPWSPNCARAVITGYIKKVEVGTEQHTRGFITLLSRQRNASEFSRINFFLYKFDIISAVVLFRYGTSGQVTQEDYYKNIASVDTDTYPSITLRNRPNIAKAIRYTVHDSKKAESIEILQPRRDNGYTLLAIERKGQIYLYSRSKETFLVDTHRAFSFHRALIFGLIKKLDVGSEEYNRSMNALQWHHPKQFIDGRPKPDITPWKLEISSIKFEIGKDTCRFVTSKEYYAGTESVDTSCDCCNVNKPLSGD